MACQKEWRIFYKRPPRETSGGHRIARIVKNTKSSNQYYSEDTHTHTLRQQQYVCTHTAVWAHVIHLCTIDSNRNGLMIGPWSILLTELSLPLSHMQTQAAPEVLIIPLWPVDNPVLKLRWDNIKRTVLFWTHSVLQRVWENKKK